MMKKIIASLLAAVTLTAAGTVIPANAAISGSGDVNSDGTIDTLDALLTLRCSAGLTKLQDDQMSQADVNGDGVVNSSDALKILSISVTPCTNLSAVSAMSEQYRLEEPIDGIDVSFWQGDIDFNKVKAAGIDFVIIRAGGATDDPSENHPNVDPRRQGVDSRFEENYRKAKAAGLGVGVYWFSFAENTEQVAREAESCLRVIEGKQLEYPVFFDLENKYQFDKGKDFCTSLTKIFCSTIRSNGYYAAFYSSSFYATNYIDDSVKATYDCWIAQWSGEVWYQSTYGMWQQGITHVDGINGDVDDDICYIDYPKYIKSRGLNNW